VADIPAAPELRGAGQLVFQGTPRELEILDCEGATRCLLDTNRGYVHTASLE
jgi:hypothetical protein